MVKTVNIVLGITGISLLLIFTLTDLATLFDFGLALDATRSGGRASDRGVDASTGQFRGKGFEKKGTVIGDDRQGGDSRIDMNTGNVIDVQSNNVIITGQQVITNSEGGGGLGSTVGLEGFQELIKEDVQIFPSIRTPAVDQQIAGTIRIEWIGGNPLVVQFAQFGGFDQFISYPIAKQIPQTVFATNPNADEKSGEFVFLLTLPENFEGSEPIIPIRLIVDTGEFSHTVVSELQITEPQSIVKSFSIAEAIRSFLAFLRIG